MKKLLVLICAVFLLGSVSAQCTSPAPATSEKMEVEKAKVIKISQSEFVKKIFDYKDANAVYKGKLPIVVDCYADWCGPCRRLAPTIEELAEQYDGQVVFYKINVDEAKEMSRMLEISSIPTVLYIKPETQPQRTVGLLDKSDLVKIIDGYLLEKKAEE